MCTEICIVITRICVTNCFNTPAFFKYRGIFQPLKDHQKSAISQKYCRGLKTIKYAPQGHRLQSAQTRRVEFERDKCYLC